MLFVHAEPVIEAQEALLAISVGFATNTDVKQKDREDIQQRLIKQATPPKPKPSPIKQREVEILKLQQLGLQIILE